jgi:hypothetical protein
MRSYNRSRQAIESRIARPAGIGLVVIDSIITRMKALVHHALGCLHDQNQPVGFFAFIDA